VNHRAFFAAAVFLFLAAPAARAAGLTGQLKPSAAVVAKIQKAANDILGNGDLGRARPDLLLAVEDNAQTDLTDLLTVVVRDDTVYDGLAATLEEAVTAEKADAARQRFVRYNLTRLHLLRARQSLRGAGGPKDALARAETEARKLVDEPATARDSAALELLGDVLVEQNRMDNARAVYERIGLSNRSAPAAYAQFKIGQMYQRALQPGLAEAAYRKGLATASAAGDAPPDLLHALYQNMAAVYVKKANFAAATDALLRSARVPAPDAAFRLRTDVAQTLLDLGYAREVQSYAALALRLTPDDEAMRKLQRAAAARLRTPGRR